MRGKRAKMLRKMAKVLETKFPDVIQPRGTESKVTSRRFVTYPKMEAYTVKSENGRRDITKHREVKNEAGAVIMEKTMVLGITATNNPFSLRSNYRALKKMWSQIKVQGSLDLDEAAFDLPLTRAVRLAAAKAAKAAQVPKVAIP